MVPDLLVVSQKGNGRNPLDSGDGKDVLPRTRGDQGGDGGRDHEGVPEAGSQVSPGQKSRVTSEAETRFKEITAAFEVLRDPAKRGRYDSQGYVGRPPPPPPPPPPTRPPKTAEDFRKERAEGPSHIPKAALDAVQCQFFGGDEARCVGRNILATLLIPKSEVGRLHPLKIKKREVCDRCHGYGDDAKMFHVKLACRDCGGSGYEFQDTEFPGLSTQCPKCRGVGYFERGCPACGGSGLDRWTIETIRVPVPRATRVACRW
jgi:molecular chaperone DnaJ